MDGSSAFAAVILVFLIAIVGHVVVQVLARRTYQVDVPLPPDLAAEFALGYFGKLGWADDAGPALINKRRRHVSRRMAYTVSVDVAELAAGSVVTFWVSSAYRNLGGLALLNPAGVWWRLTMLHRRLESVAKSAAAGGDQLQTGPTQAYLSGQASERRSARLPE